MSNKKVVTELAKSLGPILESVGFITQRGREYWKRHEKGIFHVCSYPVTKSFAYGEAVPSCSFVIELGVYYFCIDRYRKIKLDNFLPRIEDCHLRTALLKQISQPEYTRRDIWYVAADCSNLKEVGRAARESLLDIGIPWIEEFSDLSRAFDAIYLNSESEKVKGWGVAGSPAYYKLLGSIALELGRKECAYEAFRKVIEGPFERYAYDVKEDFDKLKAELESI